MPTLTPVALQYLDIFIYIFYIYLQVGTNTSKTALTGQERPSEPSPATFTAKKTPHQRTKE
jgi:hypothetical protein